MVNGKPMVSDEQTIRDMEALKEMESAIGEIVRSFREFNDVMSRGVDPIDPVKSVGWRRVTEYLMLANNRLKEAFICGDRSPASMKHYSEF